MRKYGVCLVVAAMCLPLGALAVNEGATVVAPFMAVEPVPDGVISPGEWDNAAVAPGDWSMHGAADLAAADQPTVVKVAYGLKGLYILYECTDGEPVALAGGSEVFGANTFSFGGDTDYIATYIDPANYTGPGESTYSYSIQAEPSFTANAEGDDLGNSYTFTESGQYGGFRSLFQPPRVADDGTVQYFGSGGQWDLVTSKVKDGPIDGGYAVEWLVTWEDLIGYWRHSLGGLVQIDGSIHEVELNGDQTVPELVQFGTIRTYETPADADPVPVGTGMTGLPAEGTQWQIQFARYNGTNGEYTNWVGDTGGFVSRPFGTLVFGSASGTAVRDAMLHGQ